MFAVVAVERIAEGEEETEAQKADKHSARRDATAPQRKEGGKEGRKEGRKGFTGEKGPRSSFPCIFFLSFFLPPSASASAVGQRLLFFSLPSKSDLSGRDDLFGSAPHRDLMNL